MKYTKKNLKKLEEDRKSKESERQGTNAAKKVVVIRGVYDVVAGTMAAFLEYATASLSWGLLFAIAVFIWLLEKSVSIILFIYTFKALRKAGLPLTKAGLSEFFETTPINGLPIAAVTMYTYWRDLVAREEELKKEIRNLYNAWVTLKNKGESDRASKIRNDELQALFKAGGEARDGPLSVEYA